MSGTARQKGEFLEAIYEKTRAPGAWKGAGKDSVETRFDDLRINIDRLEWAEGTSYSLWIHGPEGYLEEICDMDLTKSGPLQGCSAPIRSSCRKCTGRRAMSRRPSTDWPTP